jgi:hypothetical protein
MKTATTLTLLLMAVPSFAGPLPDKLVMPTDVGKIVITVEPCRIDYENQEVPYLYHAYATELTQGMEIIHPGCWYRNEMAVSIHFPEIGGVATFMAHLFKPEKSF